jgi:exopolysaccharide production protein ExoQ
LFGFIFAAAALAWRFDSRTLAVVLTIALAGCLGAAVGVEVFTGGFRPWAPEYRLTGSMHSNAVGVFAMLVALSSYGFAREARHRPLWWLVFAAATAAGLLCKARTSLITLAIGLLVIHYLGRPTREVLCRVCLAATLLGFAIFGAATLDRSFMIDLEHVAKMGRQDNVGTLTGRIPLWSLAWDQLQRHLLVGFGYGAYWVTERVESYRDSLGWYPHHAHSAYLQTLINVGVVGLVLLIAIALVALQHAVARVYRSGSAESRVFAAWLVVAFINGFTEVDFVSPDSPALCVAAAVFSFAFASRAATATNRISNAAQSIGGTDSAIVPWSNRPCESGL